MDRRTFLAVAISMVILFGWALWIQPRFFPEPKPQLPPPAASPAPAAVAQTTPLASPSPGAQPKEKPPAVLATVKRDELYRVELTSWGAVPSKWELLKPQYKEKVAGKMQPIDLVRTQQLPFTVTFPESSFSIAPDEVWMQLAQSGDELVYALDQGNVHLEKRYTFVPGTYQLKLKVVVENRGDQPIAEHLQIAIYGRQDPNVKQGGFFAPRVTQTEGVCHVNGKLKRGDLSTLQKERIDEAGAVRWVGVDEKYFLVAAALNPGGDAYRCNVTGGGDGVITATVIAPERKIAPHEKAEVELAGFVGPKLLNQLDDVKVASVDAKLGDAMNYGMWGMAEFIARPMLAVLKGIHWVVPNWGVAVILLTILLKLITWWPTTKSMKSMKSMAKLKPEMDRLKEKYGDDKNRMNQEVMELYKKHGINPLGGCLPMLIQMPIYIALYSMLGNSVELYRSAFVGWIHDLTAPDPYFVLPLLTGALMFAQQKLSPAPPDPQQKMMGYMMPVMFTAISLFLPSGLTVYILTNTLLTMLQQFWMNRHEPKPAKVAAKPART